MSTVNRGGDGNGAWLHGGAGLAIVQTDAASPQPDAGALAGRETSRPGVRTVAVIARDTVQVADAGAGLIRAGGDVQITNGGAGLVSAGRDVHIRNGGMGFTVAGHDVEITNGGTGFVFAGRDAAVSPGPRGRSDPIAVVAAGEARVERSFVGLVIAGRADLHNSRVLFRLPLLGVVDAAINLALRAADRALSLLEG